MFHISRLGLVLSLFFGASACKTDDGEKDSKSRATNIFPQKETPALSKPNSGSETKEKKAEGSGVNNGIGGAVVNLVSCKGVGTFTVRTTALLTAYQGLLDVGETVKILYCKKEAEADEPRAGVSWACYDFDSDDEWVVVRKDGDKIKATVKTKDQDQDMNCTERDSKSDSEE